MSTAIRPMTAEEFFEFAGRPENEDRLFELDEGEVVELPPPPTRPHGFVCGNVAFVLGNYVRDRGTGFLFTNDTGLVVSRNPDTVRSPDIALHEGDVDLEDLEEELGYSDAVPTLIVEVLSPSNRPGEVLREVNQYLHGGVKLVWVVDPVAKDVILHQPGSEPVVLRADEAIEGGETLAGFTCPVTDFFRVRKGKRGN